MRNKGQVWVETVLYTLIGLALIGLVLGFVTPRINQAKDKLIVEQAIESLNALDEKINSASQVPSNVRRAEFTMKKGELIIEAMEDLIIFNIPDLSEPYSEPGIEIDIGRVKAKSSAGQKKNSISLTLDYKNKYNITYKGEQVKKSFSQSSTPYRFTITNEGDKDINDENPIFTININEVSGT